MKKNTIILGALVITGSLLFSCNSNTTDKADAKVVPVITTDSTINAQPVVVTDTLATKEKNEKEENEKEEKNEK